MSTEERTNFYFDDHDYDQWPVYEGAALDTPVGKKSDEFVEENAFTQGPFYEFGSDFFAAQKEGTRDEIEDLLELERAVAALTVNSLHHVMDHPKTGEPYYSADFRDHPDFEAHFATLEKFWGGLPEDHPQRKTLEVIRVLRDQYLDILERVDQLMEKLPELKSVEKDIQLAKDVFGATFRELWDEFGGLSFLQIGRVLKHCKAELKTLKSLWALFETRNNIYEFIEKNDDVNVFDLIFEVFWRRAEGIDVFEVGVLHNKEHVDQQRGFFRSLFERAEVVVLEGDQASRNCFALRYCADNRDKYSSSLFHLAVDANPEVTIARVDPRNIHKISLDSGHIGNLGIGHYKNLDSFLSGALAEILRFTNPRLGEKLQEDPSLLDALMRRVSLTKDGIFGVVEMVELKKGEPFNRIYLENEDAFGDLRLQPTGFELGGVYWAEALMALKLRRLAQWQKEHNQMGPILSLHAMLYTGGIRTYFDSPALAAEVVCDNAHFSGLEPALMSFGGRNDFSVEEMKFALRGLKSSQVGKIREMAVLLYSLYEEGRETEFIGVVNSDFDFKDAFEEALIRECQLYRQRVVADYIKKNPLQALEPVAENRHFQIEWATKNGGFLFQDWDGRMKMNPYEMAKASL